MHINDRHYQHELNNNKKKKLQVKINAHTKEDKRLT